MRRHLKLAFIAAVTLLAIASVPAIAQHASKVPTATIDVTPRTVESLGLQRFGSQDATIAGGSFTGIPDSRVTLPTVCDFDSAALGCPGYCAANPNDRLNCTVEGVTPPPNPPVVVPIDPGPQVDHCGVVIGPGYPWANCSPVHGGYSCPGRGGLPNMFVCP